MRNQMEMKVVFVKFYCPSGLIKPENERLLCAKTGGKNSSLIKRDLQSLLSHSYENSTEMLIKILENRKSMATLCKNRRKQFKFN